MKRGICGHVSQVPPVNWTPENEPQSATHFNFGMQSQQATAPATRGPVVKIKMDIRILSHVTEESEDSERCQGGYCQKWWGNVILGMTFY